MLRIARTLGLALGLVGAVVLSQVPEFAQQYAQRLGGAIDELRRVVERFDADAAAEGRDRTDAIARLRADPDGLVRRRGDAAEEDARRLARLEDQRAELVGAGSSLERLAVVMRGPDPDLARRTWRDYEPAVPTTGEGLVSAGIGFLAGWGGLRLLTAALGRLGRPGRGRPRRHAAA